MAICLPLTKLSSWQQMVFGCALLERMLPNYAMFSQAAKFGDVSILTNQLNLLWQRLDKAQKTTTNYEAQLEKLELQTPDPAAFDFFGVFPALDVCMSLMSLMQGILHKDSTEFSHVSRLSENSVSYYVELLLTEEMPSEEDIDEQLIKTHPLMTWEIATQHELFDFLKDAPENKQTCQKAKAMVLEEGLSNLGIELR